MKEERGRRRERIENSLVVVERVGLEPESDQRKTFPLSLTHAKYKECKASQLEFDIVTRRDGKEERLSTRRERKDEVLTW